MLEGRLAHGDAGYDRDTFLRCVCRPEPMGEISHPQTETLRPGECAGMLVGGTLTQLVGSLGTPYAFDPPPGCVLFVDEVAERPYRLDRLLMQLKLSGLLRRASEWFSASFRDARSLTAASTRGRWSVSRWRISRVLCSSAFRRAHGRGDHHAAARRPSPRGGQ